MDVLETEERSEAAEIKQVNGALERLKNDEYGVCLACRMPIPQERLEAMPAAAHCLPCQNTKEHLKTRPPFTID